MTSGLQAVSKETDLPFTGAICMGNTGSKGFYRLPPLPALCVKALNIWLHLKQGLGSLCRVRISPLILLGKFGLERV